MSVVARTETAEQRGAIYDALVARNRLVGLLRIGLPAIGAIIFGGLILQLLLSTLVPDFGFANVRIDRDNLVFEAPSYAGTGSDGTAYTLAAEAARASLANTDLIDLQGASLDMRQPEGTSFAARAGTARLSISSQVVTVDGSTAVSSSDGLAGTVENAVIDVLHETLVAPGGADLSFADGTALRADAMAYDGKTGLWTFTGSVRLSFEETPGESDYAVRDATAGTAE